MKFEELRRGMIVNYRWDDLTLYVMIIDYDSDYETVEFTDIVEIEEEFNPRTEENSIMKGCRYNEKFSDRFSLIG